MQKIEVILTPNAPPCDHEDANHYEREYDDKDTRYQSPHQLPGRVGIVSGSIR